jgi:predicted DNA-binding transcriptional regulator AlpA
VACSPVVLRWPELGDLVGFLGEEIEEWIAF